MKSTPVIAKWLPPFVLVMILVFSGCAGAPVKSIKAAEEAIARAQSEAKTPDCLEKLTSAESFLAKAKAAMEKKNYEKAKTEVFDSLKQANEAHRCAEQWRKNKALLEENSDG